MLPLARTTKNCSRLITSVQPMANSGNRLNGRLLTPLSNRHARPIATETMLLGGAGLWGTGAGLVLKGRAKESAAYGLLGSAAMWLGAISIAIATTEGNTTGQEQRTHVRANMFPPSRHRHSSGRA